MTERITLESLLQMRASLTPEMRREIAYHEAGHAAMLFMFGRERGIIEIDMLGNQHYAARVRHAPFALGHVFMWPGISLSDIRRILGSRCEVEAKQAIMHGLAGYAAQARIYPPPYHWFDVCWEQQDSYDWNPEDAASSDDVIAALHIARTMKGRNGNAYRLLKRMADWTDEALSHPQLWAVVQALAESLLTTKRRMGASRVCRIMQSAWGNDLPRPYAQMGRKWRRRFAS